jgi:hypothetical protein
MSGRGFRVCGLEEEQEGRVRTVLVDAAWVGHVCVVGAGGLLVFVVGG